MNQNGAVILGPEHFKSFRIAAPTRTHWRDATCEEVKCPKFIQGFYIEVDMTSPMGEFQADYIRADRTRSHIEQRGEIAGTITFVFPPGNNCFGVRHKIRIDRPELFIVNEGDSRGNPRGTPPVFLRPDQWVDSFACHQDNLATIQGRG